VTVQLDLDGHPTTAPARRHLAAIPRDVEAPWRNGPGATALARELAAARAALDRLAAHGGAE
jgi:hypothetical protein